MRLDFPNKEMCLAIYSRTINAQQKLRSILREHYPSCCKREAELKKLFAAYEAAKRKQGVIDFDDMLLHWHDLLEDADIASKIGGMFDHVLVDEFQDTNTLQAAILRR